MKRTLEAVVPRVIGPRDWGEELVIAETPHYLGKILTMRAGGRGGLQYHVEKDETSYLMSGQAVIDTDDGDGRLTRYHLITGSTVRIPPGAVHRVTAVTDCVFVEFSTPHFEDRVRVEAQYGQPDSGGLPSTR